MLLWGLKDEEHDDKRPTKSSLNIIKHEGGQAQGRKRIKGRFGPREQGKTCFEKKKLGDNQISKKSSLLDFVNGKKHFEEHGEEQHPKSFHV